MKKRCTLFLMLFISALLFPSYQLSAQVAPNATVVLAKRHSPALGCSKPPCVLPNVLTSPIAADDTLIAVNPTKPMQLLSSSYSGCALAAGSLDGGSSWYLPQNCIEASSPTLAYGTQGTAYLAAGDLEVFLSTSSDNGQSWSQATGVVLPIFSGGYAFGPWLAVDNNKTSPYRNRLYLAATQVNNVNGYEIQSQISVSFSDDGGLTWTLNTVDGLQTKPSIEQYNRLAVARDGTVYVAWQRCTMTGKHVNCGGTPARMLFSKSTDGGVTWSKPVRIAVVNLVPDTCDCAFFGNLPNTDSPVDNPPLIAVDTSTGPYVGNIYAVIYNWTGKQMQVELVTSQDGGQTWGAPVPVAPPSATHDQFFPGLSVSPTGVVGVSWLDRRKDKQNVRYQPFATYSTNGGLSFAANYPLAQNLSNPYLNGNYMGDYTGNTWIHNTLYAAWPDTRNAVMQNYVGGLRIK